MASVWLVPDGLDGDRVDAAASRMTGLSRSRIEDLAAAGGVLVNSVPVAKSHRVRAGDLLEVDEIADVIYPGCYVDIIIRPWFQDNSFGKRIFIENQ